MPVSLYNLRPPRYPLTSSTNRSSYGNVFHSDSIAQPFMPDHSSGISTTGWHDFKHLEHEISFHCEVISIIFFLHHPGNPQYVSRCILRSCPIILTEVTEVVLPRLLNISFAYMPDRMKCAGKSPNSSIICAI